MRLNKWLYLFWTSLLIGTVTASVVSLVLGITDKEFEFIGLQGMGFNITTMILGGLMFSILSQMGFFAYLTVSYIALGIFRKKYLWNVTQVLLTAIVLFDLAYLPYSNGNKGESLLTYAVLPAILLVVSAAVAYWKVKMTNATAWVPSLFFMVFATTIEAMPSLQQNNWAATLFMGVPLLCCNAWQILMLHKLVSKKELTTS